MSSLRRIAVIGVAAWALGSTAAVAQPTSDAGGAQNVTVPVKLTQRLSSDAAKEGDQFTFVTTKAVKLGEVDVPSGTIGHGHVVAARKARWDRGGDLELQVDSLDFGDGRTITATAARGPKAEGHSIVGDAIKEAEKAEENLKPGEALTAALVPLSLPVRGVVLLGSALRILKGHNVTFPVGATFSVTAVPSAEGSQS